MFLRDVGMYLQVHTALQSGRPTTMYAYRLKKRVIWAHEETKQKRNMAKKISGK
jgi:hypothetical protein